MSDFRSTTVLMVRRDGRTCMASDGQVTLGDTVLKAGADRTSGDLSDLAAYRDLVRSVRDWPINTSSYVRFALYLLIPVTSWAAAAVVERLVDAML